MGYLLLPGALWEQFMLQASGTVWLGLAELSPTPTEELVHMFNELRSDLVLLYELKQACANCEYELQMLRHRHEALARAGVLGAPATPALGPAPASSEPAVSDSGLGLDPTKDTIIDVVGAPLTPNSVRAWTGLGGACPGCTREHTLVRDPTPPRAFKEWLPP